MPSYPFVERYCAGEGCGELLTGPRGVYCSKCGVKRGRLIAKENRNLTKVNEETKFVRNVWVPSAPLVCGTCNGAGFRKPKRYWVFCKLCGFRSGECICKKK